MKKLKLTTNQKKSLLKTARLTIQHKLDKNLKEAVSVLGDSVFSEVYGLFVTLSIEGHLRGCIGYIEGVEPIRDAISRIALEAAFHDPRFSPLNFSELPEIELEVSILYPLETVTALEEIQVGRDGLVMSRGMYKGLLLPQVATEWNWEREEFLNQTCRKAGMEVHCWENGAIIQKFEADVFSEKDFK